MTPPTPINGLEPCASPVSVREQLLHKIRSDSGLPTLGVALSKVVDMTSSGEDSIAQLAHFILSDVALSQQILRLSNTIAYRTASGNSVTTISRAIFLLGFDTIKTHALATLLVDGFKDKRQALTVRRELVHALCASLAAREIAHRANPQHSEEAAVVALFKNIGKVLLASFDHPLYESILRVTHSDPNLASDTCHKLLGCSIEHFGETVLNDWKIPATIIHALQPLPGGELKKALQRPEWLRQVASLSECLADLLVTERVARPQGHLATTCKTLVKRFGSALDIDSAQLESILKKVEHQTQELAISLEIALPGGAALFNDSATADAQLCHELMLPEYELATLSNAPKYPSGKPTNARDLLLAGISDMTHLLSANQIKLNDVFLLFLETLYAAMGFRFATICLRDLNNGQFISRLAIGENHLLRQKAFHFIASDERSIFQLALLNNADMLIADALSTKIAELLPDWHKRLLPDTRSFIVLPLHVEGKPLGLFYADRIFPAEEGVPPDETALIKTLKAQLLSAMRKH